jgi:hypothetical protein
MFPRARLGLGGWSSPARAAEESGRAESSNPNFWRGFFDSHLHPTVHSPSPRKELQRTHYGATTCAYPPTDQQTPQSPRLHPRTPTSTRPSHAARNTTHPRLPGPHTVRAWRVLQHLHIRASGHPKGSPPNRKPAHGLVSARMVLSHGSHRCVHPPAEAIPTLMVLQ